MISKPRILFALSFGVMIAATTSAHTWRSVVGNGASISEPAGELTCMNCVYHAGEHKFMTESPTLCEDEEHCENNNCRGCGGESQCHEDFQEGPCHVECDCDGQHHEEDEEDPVTELDLALAASDAERLAVLITQGQV